MRTEAAHESAWWDSVRFSDGPETEWFVRSAFGAACRARTAIYWRCMSTRRSVETLDERLREAGWRLIVEHNDHPRTCGRRQGQLHRVYVEKDGNGVAIVNRTSSGVSLSVASFDAALAERLTEDPGASKERSRRGASRERSAQGTAP